ncbi:Josephin-2 [Coemansia biformis]|uniref:ubiquitinyl hydrolase 1 n=1 Tax=Coemansia biformis TaxID=1286918 RepID=A0A9W7Y568_9FUNG|nr:Josephin-2 [Coemansia biformis]
MKLRESPIYHEQQSFWLCAKLQQEAVSHADLERIAKHLHEIQPEQGGWLRLNSHKNMLGFGYYDVNVITAALHEQGYDLLWHNRASGIEDVDLDGTVGIIVHARHNWFFRGSHWFAIKHFDQSLTVPVVPTAYVGQPRAARSVEERETREYESQTYPPGFWNLDSKLAHPEYIGDMAGLNAFLLKLGQRNRVHVLLVAPSADQASVSTSSAAPPSAPSTDS